MKIGGKLIADYSFKVGLGAKTGIPLAAEAEGRIPTDEYWLKVYGRKMLNGDLANLSIGQGDLLITPLQMAQAMGAVGNGGTLYQTRLVSQVQAIDGQIVNAYNTRARGQIDIDDAMLAELKRGMIQVVSGRGGTAGQAQVPGINVAGKTGTAQWGPKKQERTAAWFAGYAPAEKPKYAFAALYEGEVNNDEVHGGTFAAPIVGRVLRELFKEQPKEKKPVKRRARRPENEEDIPVRRAEPVVRDGL
jgi:penicillin-binding protein 2